jgi:hypothetical protein
MFKGITLFTLTMLLVCVASWKPQSGLTSDDKRQAGLSIKNMPETGGNASALWVRNLGNHSARLTVSADSASAQENSYVNESIAGGHTVRLDKSLPATLRGSNDLLIRSEEQIAVIAAPDNLPVDRSEFYYWGIQQEGVGAVVAPKWVMELGAIGKTGANVIKPKSTGYAPAVKGQSETNKRYVFGVGVALRKDNGSVEIKLISRTEQVIKSLVLSSSTALFWQGELGEFISGADDFPSRVEVTALSGKAQGFLSMKDAETAETILLPVVPARRNAASKGKVGGIHTASGGGGYGYFTHGALDCPGSSYAYEVFYGPPYACGTLHIVRNGVSEVTPGWICTNGSGYAIKGPWTVSTNQTGTSIYIEWPDGSTTSGDDYKIDDASPPSVRIDTCRSDVIEGIASDTPWGVGFNSSSVVASFRQTNSPYKFWDGSGYNSPYEVWFYCSISPYAGGYNINWSIVPPPSAGGTQVHVEANDICNAANAYCSY